MSFGDGNLHEKCEEYRRQLGGMTAAHNRTKARIAELETENSELRKRVDNAAKCAVETATDLGYAENAIEEWRIDYESLQDETNRLEAENDVLRELASDMYWTWKRLDESGEWPDPEPGSNGRKPVHNGHNGWKVFTERLQKTGIEVEV